MCFAGDISKYVIILDGFVNSYKIVFPVDFQCLKSCKVILQLTKGDTRNLATGAVKPGVRREFTLKVRNFTFEISTDYALKCFRHFL